MNQRPKDKLLQAVLNEQVLYKFAEYDPEDYLSVDDAIDSTNETVSAVGRIIERLSSDPDTYLTELYNEVCNHLR